MSDDKTFEVGAATRLGMRPDGRLVIPTGDPIVHNHYSWTHGWSTGAINIAAYFGVGAWCHVLFRGDAFDPTGMVSWAWVTCWPLGLMAKVVIWVASVALWIFGGMVLIVLWGLLGYFLWKLGEGWRLKHRVRRMAERRAAEQAS